LTFRELLPHHQLVLLERPRRKGFELQTKLRGFLHHRFPLTLQVLPGQLRLLQLIRHRLLPCTMQLVIVLVARKSLVMATSQRGRTGEGA